MQQASAPVGAAPSVHRPVVIERGVADLGEPRFEVGDEVITPAGVRRRIVQRDDAPSGVFSYLLTGPCGVPVYEDELRAAS